MFCTADLQPKWHRWPTFLRFWRTNKLVSLILQLRSFVRYSKTFVLQEHAQVNPQQCLTTGTRASELSVWPHTEFARARCLQVSTGEFEGQKTFTTDSPTPLKRFTPQISTLGMWYALCTQPEEDSTESRGLWWWSSQCAPRCKDELDMAITKVWFVFH